MDEHASTVLKTEATFVWVPVLVKSGNGSALTDIDPASLRLMDNGTAASIEKVKTDDLPISLVILMQTGGSAAECLREYEALPELVGSFVGNAVHEITFATFDSHVEQIWHFPARTDGLDYALRHQHPGDKGAAIDDAVSFGIRQLESEPGRFRRVILLLSQQADGGSSIVPRMLLQQIGSSSTVVYSVTFPTDRPRASRSKRVGNIDSGDNADIEVVGLLSIQTAEELSRLTGGSYSQFTDEPSFNSAMLQSASDFHRLITLGFQPRCCKTGFHRITVNCKSPKLRVTARQFYWRLPPD